MTGATSYAICVQKPVGKFASLHSGEKEEPSITPNDDYADAYTDDYAASRSASATASSRLSTTGTPTSSRLARPWEPPV